MKNNTWRKALILVACSVFLAAAAPGVEKPAVQVDPTESVGPRTPEKQTATAVVRDYLQAWQTLSDALGGNRPDLLDRDFLGTAKLKLTQTIEDQTKLKIATQYRDTAHHIRLLFYSPEGLSMQLLDTVEYDVQITDHDKVRAMQHVRSRYVAVLTPTEVRWKVRIFQAGPE